MRDVALTYRCKSWLMYLLILNALNISEQNLNPCSTAVGTNNKSSAGLVNVWKFFF